MGTTHATPFGRLEHLLARATPAPLHTHGVLTTVIYQPDAAVLRHSAVNRHDGIVAAHLTGRRDGNHVDRGSECVTDGEGRPLTRHVRDNAQGVTDARETQQVLDADAIHPARRARVPRPSAAPPMCWCSVDVSGHDIRLGLVTLDLRGGRAVRE